MYSSAMIRSCKYVFRLRRWDANGRGGALDVVLHSQVSAGGTESFTSDKVPPPCMLAHVRDRYTTIYSAYACA